MKPQVRMLVSAVLAVGSIFAGVAWFLVGRSGSAESTDSLIPANEVRASAALAAPLPSAGPDGVAAPGRRLLEQVRQTQETAQTARILAGRLGELTQVLARPAGQSPEELERVAIERRAVLKQLIPQDPAAALRHRLGGSERRALPASVRVHLEEEVDAFAKLEALAVCGRESGGSERYVQIGARRLRAYPAGSRSEVVSQERMPVHGLAVDGLVAIAEEPYRMLGAGEVAGVAALGGGVTAMVGDEQRQFASLTELADWAGRIRAEETILPSAFGVRKILFIMVDFSDAVGAPTTIAEIDKSMQAVNAFYGEMSANRTRFSHVVIPGVYRAPKLKTVYSSDPSSYGEIMTDAKAAARLYDKSNGGSGLYDPDKYDHVAVAFSAVAGYSGWAGWGDIPGSRIWLNGYWDPQIISHELGHNLGLSHAYAWKPAGSSSIGSGLHVEYGDPFDSMGVAATAALENRQFCVPKKRALGFVSDSNLVQVNGSGKFRVFRHDGVVGSKAVGLRVAADSAYDYWIEYRKIVPIDISDFSSAAESGVQIRWNKIPSFTKAGATGTYLLDMTPGSNGDMKDSMLTLGRSFYDPTYKIRITPVQTGTSVDGDWIDVAVVIGDVPDNRPPVIQSAYATETAFARVPLNLVARASDGNGDTVLYQWDFGDGVPVYSTSAAVQKTWLKTGVFSASVRAFDVNGGETSQVVVVNVNDPLASWTKVEVQGLTEGLKSICFGSGKFVAVGEYATCSSSDGRLWSKSVQGTRTMNGSAVAYGNGSFVAVGGNYNFTTASFGSGIFISSDGVSWETLPTSRTEWLHGIVYGAGRFVAVGGSGLIWSSTDARTWSASQLNSKRNLKSVGFNGTDFLAVGEAGAAFFSKDGLVWYDISVSDSNSDNDGISWFKDTEGSAVIFRDGAWFVLSSWVFNSAEAGIAWSATVLGKWQAVRRTYFTFDLTYPSVASFAGGAGLFTFPGKGTAAEVAVSTDGKAWSSLTLAPSGSGCLHGAAEGNGRIVIVGDKGQIFVSSDGPPAIAKQPQSQTVAVGGRISLSVTAYATGPFTYQWRRNGVVLAGATGDTFSIATAGAGDSGEYAVAVSNSRGVVLSAVASVLVQPSVAAPVFAASPVSQTVSEGGSVQLFASATGSPAPTYQWFKDGVALAGMTGTTLTVAGDGSASGGAYTVTATNASGTVTSGAAVVRVIPGSRLANLSVRSTLQTGDTLIVGAVVTEGSRGLLIRAAGPALAPFGLSGLPDPALELYGSGSQLVASNNDWNSSLASVFQSVGAFAFAPGSKDAALSPVVGGAFTAQVKGVGSGSVLVETYDLGSGFTPRLVNLSARYRVGTGPDVLIAGFSVAGSGTKQVLVRAVGPTLSQFGVNGVLADPQLEILDASGRVLGSNDTWSPSLSATFSRLGAFPLQSGSRDAALLITLPAGANYSVKVSGVNNTVGEAMVEVYEVF